MNDFSKSKSESRIDERSEKEKLIQNSMRDLPIINALHIADLEYDVKKLRTDIIFVEILMALLSFALFLQVVVK